LEALGINLGFLIAQIIGFLIMVAVLQAWVFGPISSSLATRREMIAQGLEDARIASEARANAEKEATRIKADAQAQASEIVRQATERAESAAKDIRTAAETEAAKIRADATLEVEREKERMLADLRPQVVALAMAAAQKLIGESLDEQRQHALLKEFFSGVRSGEVVVLEGKKASGASAEVTSAVTLTSEEQETIKKDLLAKAGTENVHFRVDPSILGGLVIKVGDRVLDGSVMGQLSELRASLS
jgi:F-type H+-transporting ATPase subunit b